jgi:hypothetical protein
VQPPRRSPRKAKVSMMHHWRVWLDVKSPYRSLSLNSIPRGPQLRLQAPTEADRQPATDPRAKTLQSKITSVLKPKMTTQTKKGQKGKKKRGRQQGEGMEGGDEEEGEEQAQRGAKVGYRKKRQVEYCEDSSTDTNPE